MESASRKIAELLDSSLSSETETSSSTLRKNDFEDFDIGDLCELSKILNSFIKSFMNE